MKKSEWEILGIKRSTYFKYRNLGLPEKIEEAREWITARVALTGRGGNSVRVEGKSFSAAELIDLKGRLLEEQVKNLELKNKIERLKFDEKRSRLVTNDEAAKVIQRILLPLRARLDQLPDRLGGAINPSAPDVASSILEGELNSIYAELNKSLSNKL